MAKSNQPAPWVRKTDTDADPAAVPEGLARTELADAQRSLLKLFAWSFVIAVAAGLVMVVLYVVYSGRTSSTEQELTSIRDQLDAARRERDTAKGDADAAERTKRKLERELMDEQAERERVAERLKVAEAALAAIREQDRNPAALRAMELHDLLGENRAMKLVVAEPSSETPLKGITREVVEQVARQRAKSSALRVDGKADDLTLTVNVLYLCDEGQTHCAVSVGAFLDTMLRAPDVGNTGPARIGVQLWGMHQLNVDAIDSDQDVRDLISEAVGSLFDELFVKIEGS